MQRTFGVFKLLGISWIYAQFQNAVGAGKLNRWLAKNLWRLETGARVLDIGCGPGTVFSSLPNNIDYVGFDISNEYIESANRKFGARATFVAGVSADFLSVPDPRMQNRSLAICNGVMHHISDDECIELLSLAKASLADGGRFVGIEPVHLLHESAIAKWLMNQDRGQFVRTETQWKRLVAKVFHEFDTYVVTSLLRIPYNHIIIECHHESATKSPDYSA